MFITRGTRAASLFFLLCGSVHCVRQLADSHKYCCCKHIEGQCTGSGRHVMYIEIGNQKCCKFTSTRCSPSYDQPLGDLDKLLWDVTRAATPELRGYDGVVETCKVETIEATPTEVAAPSPWLSWFRWLSEPPTVCCCKESPGSCNDPRETSIYNIHKGTYCCKMFSSRCSDPSEYRSDLLQLKEASEDFAIYDSRTCKIDERVQDVGLAAPKPTRFWPLSLSTKICCCVEIGENACTGSHRGAEYRAIRSSSNISKRFCCKATYSHCSWFHKYTIELLDMKKDGTLDQHYDSRTCKAASEYPLVREARLGDTATSTPTSISTSTPKGTLLLLNTPTVTPTDIPTGTPTGTPKWTQIGTTRDIPRGTLTVTPTRTSAGSFTTTRVPTGTRATTVTSTMTGSSTGTLVSKARSVSALASSGVTNMFDPV